MTDSFLILHRVRDAPAYDIAHRMRCPECAGDGCLECADLGYWWITSTYGHRAYPSFWGRISALNLDWDISISHLPDHFNSRTSKPAPVDLSKLLPLGPSLSRRP